MVEHTLTVMQAVRRIIPSCKHVTYIEASIEEKAVARKILSALWQGDSDTAKLYAQEAEAHGLILEHWNVEGHKYWVLREENGKRHGAGNYAVREATAPKVSILLQAPHAHFDKKTGSISAQIFFNPVGGEVRKEIHGLFASSLHRYQIAPGKRLRSPDSPADPCHNPGHLYAAVTESILSVGKRITVVQLHGFAEGTNERAKQRGTNDAIISAGTEISSDTSSAVAKSLVDSGFQILRFAEDIKHLGGTKNLQYKAAQAAGEEFVHIEMSKNFREKLQKHEAVQASLASALLAGMKAKVVLESVPAEEIVTSEEVPEVVAETVLEIIPNAPPAVIIEIIKEIEEELKEAEEPKLE